MWRRTRPEDGSLKDQVLKNKFISQCNNQSLRDLKPKMMDSGYQKEVRRV